MPPRGTAVHEDRLDSFLVISRFSVVSLCHADLFASFTHRYYTWLEILSYLNRTCNCEAGSLWSNLIKGFMHGES